MFTVATFDFTARIRGCCRGCDRIAGIASRNSLRSATEERKRAGKLVARINMVRKSRREKMREAVVLVVAIGRLSLTFCALLSFTTIRGKCPLLGECKVPL